MLHHHNRPYIDAVDAGRRELHRLVGAAADGDPFAWNALVERFRTRVSRTARVHQLGAHDVDDVAQETWVRLLENIRAIREPDAVGAWLETTAKRESLKVIRAVDRVRPCGDELLGDAACTDDPDLEAQERRAALAAALERLPDRQQALLGMLYDDAEPSYAEISDRLGLPIGSIGPTRARALSALSGDAVLARQLK
jgi:RNA polymerase sigma factor (sigma-70 family)